MAAGQSGETITDFENDINKFVLDGELNFEYLNIRSTGNKTVIINNNTVLALIQEISALTISVEDFVFDT